MFLREYRLINLTKIKIVLRWGSGWTPESLETVLVHGPGPQFRLILELCTIKSILFKDVTFID